MPRVCTKLVITFQSLIIHGNSRSLLGLFVVGEGSLAGTNDAVFIDILSHRSYLHLFEVQDEYYLQYGSTLKTAIQVSGVLP